MTDLLVFVRNIVLALILGWLGLQFGAADANEHEEAVQDSSGAIRALF